MAVASSIYILYGEAKTLKYDDLLFVFVVFIKKKYVHKCSATYIYIYMCVY